MTQEMYQQKFFEELQLRGISPERAALLIYKLNKFLTSENEEIVEPYHNDEYSEKLSAQTDFFICTHENLYNKLTDFLTFMGFHMDLNGFNILRDSIIYCIQRNGRIIITRDLYPSLAEKNNASFYSIERGIRYSICQAFKRCPEKFIDFLGDHLDGNPPDNSEFIFFVADKFKRNLL